MTKSLSRLMAAFAALSFALLALGAFAQEARGTAEPTVAQIYQATNSGNLDKANAMIEEVLKSHPNSARAHYVKAELAARGRQFDVARRELATAEKIAPGLPFAKAESVQALRNQLADAATANLKGDRPVGPRDSREIAAPASRGGYVPQPVAERPFPWGMLIVVAAIVGIGAMVLRRRQRAMESASMSGGPTAAGHAQPGYQQPGYGPAGAGYYGPDAGAQPYPPGYQPQQPSMGSSLARGAATGLAIGAGALAAQEIGRRMFEHGNANAAPLAHDTGNHPTLDQIDEGMRRNLNTDMGGDNFGMDAGGGWDAGGGGDVGGGDGGGEW
jgi:hypothetical protein